MTFSMKKSPPESAGEELASIMFRRSLFLVGKKSMNQKKWLLFASDNNLCLHVQVQKKWFQKIFGQVSTKHQCGWFHESNKCKLCTMIVWLSKMTYVAKSKKRPIQLYHRMYICIYIYIHERVYLQWHNKCEYASHIQTGIYSDHVCQACEPYIAQVQYTSIISHHESLCIYFYTQIWSNFH